MKGLWCRSCGSRDDVGDRDMLCGECWATYGNISVRVVVDGLASLNQLVVKELIADLTGKTMTTPSSAT